MEFHHICLYNAGRCLDHSFDDNGAEGPVCSWCCVSTVTCGEALRALRVLVPHCANVIDVKIPPMSVAPF